MQALAGVGFSNLADLQGEVIKVIPGVSARIEKSLRAISHETLPSGISIYCYFEQIPTARTPAHIRIYEGDQVVVRLDVIAPHMDSTADEMLDRFLAVWSEMLRKLANYLRRKRVPKVVAQSVIDALCLPAA